MLAKLARKWWLVALRSVFAIFLGVLTVIMGILDIVAVIQLRWSTTGKWLNSRSGSPSVLFGLVLMIVPGAGALSRLTGI